MGKSVPQNSQTPWIPIDSLVRDIFGDTTRASSHKHKHVGFRSITFTAGSVEAVYTVSGIGGTTLEGTMRVPFNPEDSLGKVVSAVEEELRRIYRKSEKVA